MAKMYIANCTQQRQDFSYRLPETPSARSQMIEIGGQIVISGDLSPEDIDAIIKQHEVYGLVRDTDIDRTKPFIGTCYSLNKPVDLDKVRTALFHNNDVLEELGRKIREEAALSVNNELEQAEGGSTLKQIELSVVEEPDRKSGEYKEGVKPLAEGVRVSRQEQGADQGRGAYNQRNGKGKAKGRR